jgi:hypothetical protein
MYGIDLPPVSLICGLKATKMKGYDGYYALSYDLLSPTFDLRLIALLSRILFLNKRHRLRYDHDERCCVIQHQHRKEEGETSGPKRHEFGQATGMFFVSFNIYTTTKQLFLATSTTTVTNNAASSSTNIARRRGDKDRQVDLNDTSLGSQVCFLFLLFIYTN